MINNISMMKGMENRMYAHKGGKTKRVNMWSV